MNFLDHLRQNFQSQQSSPQAPANLSILGESVLDSLRQRKASVELIRACRQWGRAVEVVQRSQHERMQHMRGQPKKLWTEQQLIYQDLVCILGRLAELLENQSWEEVAQESRSYVDLLDELQVALEAMDEWWNSEELRCLRCGASPPESHCRHCELTLMRPIRRFAPAGARQVSLGEAQAEVLKGIQSVNAGMADLAVLQQPLQQLDAIYRQVLQTLPGPERAPQVVQGLRQALQGIETMRLCFDDHDAQHLEDGWHRFFTSELALKDFAAEVQAAEGAALAQVSEFRIDDQVQFSDEE